MRGVLENDLFFQLNLSKDGMGFQARGWFPPSLEIFRQELMAHFWGILLSETGMSEHWTKVTNITHSCKIVWSHVRRW